MREKGGPKALPSMCVLTIKRDENLLPLRAKSRIVVLGNHEETIWSKSDKFAPVLRGNSLRFLVSLAVEKRRTLRQGNCKNAFCQSELPPEEVTVIRPPSGDPDVSPNEYWLLKKTLYGLRKSPRHWFKKIDGIFRSMGLRPNQYDPCLYSGFLRDPLDPSAPASSVPITLGLYVDDFVYFLESDDVERKFDRILREQVRVDFMGVVEWFLGTHFLWHVTPSTVKVHLNQAGYAANLVERHNMHLKAPTPTATPYRSGIPIDSIEESTLEDDDPVLCSRRERYQSIVGGIGWLVNCTRPDLAPAHTFLSSYNHKPSQGHLNAAKHVLHYIYSTHDYGISFSSDNTTPMHTHIHFPDSCDKEAYTDAKPPVEANAHKLTTYSDASWGGQYGEKVCDSTPLPLFKFCSMSGFIVFRCGGPVSWGAVCQNQTALSSCEAEIRATNEGAKRTKEFRNLVDGMIEIGYAMLDLDAPTKVYNGNEGCVAWAHNMY